MAPFKIINFSLSLWVLSSLFLLNIASANKITVGSKMFTESYVLAEILGQLIEAQGYEVDLKKGLGGTFIAFEALKNNEIQIYPEYTGTITGTILAKELEVEAPSRKMSDIHKINSMLNDKNLYYEDVFKFQNNYGIAISKLLFHKFKLTKISDLKDYPLWVASGSFEFSKREDGWIGLAKAYSLNHKMTPMDHLLSFSALEKENVQFIEIYTTDAKVKMYDLKVLEDDLGFFPEYKAGFLAHKSLPEKLRIYLASVDLSLSNEEMRNLNAAVEIDKMDPSDVATEFLKSKGLIKENQVRANDISMLDEIFHKLRRHLILVLVGLFSAILFTLPLMIVLWRHPKLQDVVTSLAGLFQTVPSIALLALLIPIFGIGVKPAFVALFLYSLLPIMRNALIGLRQVDPQLISLGEALGMTQKQVMIKVRFPLAWPVILAGIRSAAVINVGTATLAAFIGAGGLGEFIVMGLTMADTRLILMGAIPAILLALIFEVIFECIDRRTNYERLMRS